MTTIYLLWQYILIQLYTMYYRGDLHIWSSTLGWLAGWPGKYFLYGFTWDILTTGWIHIDCSKSSSIALESTVFVILYRASQHSESFFDVHSKWRLFIDNQMSSLMAYAGASECLLSTWIFIQSWAFSRLFVVSSKVLAISLANPSAAGAFKI